MSPILDEIKPETAERLAALAKARGKSIDEYLNSLLPPAYAHTKGEETIGQRLQRKSLIGIIGGKPARARNDGCGRLNLPGRVP